MTISSLNTFCYGFLALAIFLTGCRQNNNMYRPFVKRRQSQAYALKVISPTVFRPGNTLLQLQVIDIKTKQPIQRFIKDQGELAHITLVNQQFNHFQHVHPSVNSSGIIKAPIKIREDGGNIAYLRFSTEPGEREVLKTFFYVEDDNKFSFDLPQFNPMEVSVDSYKFQLEPVYSKLHQPTLFTVNVFKDNKPASVETYKGQSGHGVLINQTEWSLIPLDSLPSFSYYHQGKRYFKSPYTFMATIEEPGNYSLWLQFKIDGKMQIVRFRFPVCRETPCAIDY